MCLVSESFGSSSDASLRKPPTWFHRVRACAGGNDFTRSDRRPIRPQRPPEHPPLLGHTHLPPTPHRIGSRQVKGRNRLSDSSVAMQGGNSRLSRQVIPTASGAFLGGAPIKDNPFAARRPFTHCRTFIQVSRVILATVRVLLGCLACDSCQLLLLPTGLRQQLTQGQEIAFRRTRFAAKPTGVLNVRFMTRKPIDRWRRICDDCRHLLRSSISLGTVPQWPSSPSPRCQL